MPSRRAGSPAAAQHLVDIHDHLRAELEQVRELVGRVREGSMEATSARSAIDRALADHLRQPGDFSGVEAALDLLSDTLLSHVAYEERELVESLARLGLYAGQLAE